MKLDSYKTKIVATIGPASESPEVMRQMLEAGMAVARINLSHGDFSSHQRVITNLRRAAKNGGRRLALMVDLPGSKMRLGQISPEPVELAPGASFSLIADEIVGDAGRASERPASHVQEILGELCPPAP